MIGMALSAMMAVQPAAMPLSPYDLPYDTRACVAPLLGRDRSQLGALIIYVDPDDRPLLTQIGISIGSGLDEHSVSWPWPMERDDPGASASFIYDLYMPPETAFPVTVLAYFDGEQRWTQRFDAPTGGIDFGALRSVPSLPRTGPIERLVRSVRYVRIISPRIHAFPNFAAARELRLRARDAGGGTVAEETIALPGWRHLRRQARRAHVAAEDLRRSRKCRIARLPPSGSVPIPAR